MNLSNLGPQDRKNAKRAMTAMTGLFLFGLSLCVLLGGLIYLAVQHL